MQPRRDAIEERLERIGESVQLLEEIRASGADIDLDAVARYATERALQVAIAAALDIGSTIIAAEGWRRPADYTEIIEILGAHGVLPPAFARSIKLMASLRNILVHEYLKVDPVRLAEHLERLDDLRAFRGYVLDYLERNEPPGG